MVRRKLSDKCCDIHPGMTHRQWLDALRKEERRASKTAGVEEK